ncbi:MAG: cell envelope integrity protein TolA [Oxalobacteraceae bacterium]|nr:cell envelope integrity protein TolA [Oxalobacteraceae bacterium]
MRHYQIPSEPGRLRALGLALFVHLVLLGFLWFGVSWQSDTPVAVEAEIWNPVAREAAPPPPPPPEPVPEPPRPAPAVEPPKPAPVAEPVKPKLPDPDIALEKEKKRKQEKEDAERKKKEQLAEQKAREEEDKRKKLAEAQEKNKEKKKLAELEKQKLAEEQKQKEQTAAEEKKRLAEEQQRKQEELAAEQRAKKRREDDLRRQMQLAGEGGAGDAEKSQGPRSDGGYARRVAGLIKSHTILPQSDIPGNPAVEYTVELLPDGSLRGEPKMTRSSGISAFDQAVRRAIDKTAPFPPDPATGKVPSSISISHRPKDSDQR